MIDPIYTLNHSEIKLLSSLLNQLDIWYEPDVSFQIRLHIEHAVTSGTITHDAIQQLLLLLSKSKQQRPSKPEQETHDTETTSDSWDEMLELLETHKKTHAKQIALDASLRSHLQSAVYNRNLPNRCMLALRKVISRNKGKQPCLRRHI